ncbi:MAG TPA: glycosyltransferase [Planctomycetota bacterium]|nr:glycosyltransferase [Planctomycetota bacterium]
MTGAGDGDIPITVVMRCYNDAPLLPRTLTALRAQRGVTWSLIVFESASTDASPSIIADFGPDRIEHLQPGSYRSARVMNRGAAWATTELIAYLNSDAVMEHDRVLRQLADAILADERCAGAFAAQTVRPDASTLTRLDYDVAFARRHELAGDEAHWLSMVCSMIRASAWRDEPFDERLTYAEDAVWSARQRARGRHIRFVPEARAEHSHEYTAAERYRRDYGDKAALAVLATRSPRGAIGGLLWPFAKRCLRDSWRLCRMGCPSAVLRLPFHRWPQLKGAWHGARDGWRHWHGADAQKTQPFLRRA